MTMHNGHHGHGHHGQGRHGGGRGSGRGGGFGLRLRDGSGGFCRGRHGGGGGGRFKGRFSQGVDQAELQDHSRVAAEGLNQQYCPLCDNHCPLSAPSCPKGRAYAARAMGGAKEAQAGNDGRTVPNAEAQDSKPNDEQEGRA